MACRLKRGGFALLAKCAAHGFGSLGRVPGETNGTRWVAEGFVALKMLMRLAFYIYISIHLWCDGYDLEGALTLT